MTNSTLNNIILVSSLITLTACGGGGGGGDVTPPPASPPPPAPTINIYTESSQSTGTPVDVSGVWETPCKNNKIKIMTFDSNTYSYAEKHYASTDTSCSNAPTQIYNSDSQLPATTNGSKIVTEWRDPSTNPIAAPTRSDNAGPLTAQPTVSRVDIDTTGGTFFSIKDKQIFYIDDTTKPWMMYLHHFQSIDSEGYPNNLASFEPLYKVSDASTISLLTATKGSLNLQSGDLQGSINTACYENGNSDGIIETVSMNDTQWTYTVKTHAGDNTCSTLTSSTTAVATLEVGSNKKLKRWIDGMGVYVDPPATAADSQTALPIDAPYTVFNGVVTSSNNPSISVGQIFSEGYIIDSSSADGVVLYRIKNAASNSGLGRTADPFTNIP